MSETDNLTFYGVTVPRDAHVIGFRGIDHGTMVDILPDRRVSNKMENYTPYLKEFTTIVQAEFDTHISEGTKLQNMEYDKFHEHSVHGGDIQMRWRRAGGYLYFLAWRVPENGE